MKCGKPVAAGPSACRVRGEQCDPAVSASNPELALPLRKLQETAAPPRSPRVAARRTPRDIVPREAHSASESNLSVRQNETGVVEEIPIEQKFIARGDERCPTMLHRGSPPPSSPRPGLMKDYRVPSVPNPSMVASIRAKTVKNSTVRTSTVKPSRSCGVEISGSPTLEGEQSTMRQVRDIHKDLRTSARIIKDSRARLLEIQKKGTLSDVDMKELKDRHELLLREMDRFDRLTRTIQRLVDKEVLALRNTHQPEYDHDYGNGPCYPCGTLPESAMFHEMKMTHPTVLLGGHPTLSKTKTSEHMRCRSEIDLTRKLSESYDMQEKLVADNADLEVKRYILYKELMTKDQNLETCRAQIKRFQDELKMMSNENAMLHEKLSRNNPKGDGTPINDCIKQKLYDSDQESELYSKSAQQLASKVTSSSSTDLEKQLSGLENEVQLVKAEMDQIKRAAEQTSREGAGGPACRKNPGQAQCYTQQPGGPPPPAMMKACGVCPPCPAPCNPNAPPTPAEREVAKLTIQLRQTEENFKQKVTECAMLRSELMKKKEELEKERCQHREVTNRFRELEMKYEGLQTHTNMLLGTKEQALEVEVNVRALKQCYREAREEIDELRILLKEQNEQLQDYRVKYMQAQQLVEEQKRQMDMMDMDNNRISEQINLEIQKVKLKFQEKLQELAPLPDLLKATQMKLKDAQQSQALAEHNAEQLARELNCARERVHVLMHNIVKPPEKPAEKAGTDERQMLLLSQRISQLTETNLTLKQEIERLKANIIRSEEAVLQNERRLQEKMHECAQLGGELDRARDEAARAIQRVNERSETVRKCLQTTIAELERQLAACRARVKSVEKEREELQMRMTCQIKRLNENFEQAQLRIMGLSTQVATLRHGMPSGAGDDQEEPTECQCKTLFEHP